jgi:hypothetical protein
MRFSIKYPRIVSSIFMMAIYLLATGEIKNFQFTCYRRVLNFILDVYYVNAMTQF